MGTAASAAQQLLLLATRSEQRAYTFNVAAPAAGQHFTFTAPSGVTSGVPFNMTVTAVDASNAPITSYAGTVHFTTTPDAYCSGGTCGLTQGSATAPADYTFVAGDNGAHTFSFTLSRSSVAGNYTIAVRDTAAAAINGSILIAVP